MRRTPDNAGSREDGPTVIVALRAGRPEHTPEAEAVMVEHAGDHVVLILDDGERLEFDAVELRTAIAGRGATLREAA